MTTLADFLLARIAEDEAVANLAASAAPGEPYVKTERIGTAWHAVRGMVTGGADLWDCEGAESLMMANEAAQHIARHDPARVLRVCEAHRRIVEWCSERTRVFVGRLGEDPTDPANYVPGDYAHPDDAPVLRLIALPYADHPDYRSEWKL